MHKAKLVRQDCFLLGLSFHCALKNVSIISIALWTSCSVKKVGIYSNGGFGIIDVKIDEENSSIIIVIIPQRKERFCLLIQSNPSVK